MAFWRNLGSVVLVLAITSSGRSQSYTLAETLKEGDCYRFHLDMSLSGEIRVSREGKMVSIKLGAGASHEFPERVLKLMATGTAEKTARFYDSAKATIQTGREKSERSLRVERRLVVAQRHKELPLFYSPSGPLNREELELTSEHFDTLCLTGLLPGKEVKLGETWKLSNPIVQALCGFEGLTEQSVTCKLDEVKDDLAMVSVTGTASGIDLGAVVKVTLDASYRFDLKGKHLVAVQWKQKDERDQGPASPATVVEATTNLTRTAIETPETLHETKLVGIPEGFDPPQTLTNLVYRDPKNRYDLIHGREWQGVGRTEEHHVLRLMERGDFVAQVTITVWKPAEKGKHLSPEEFAQAMADTPGWEPTKELQSGEVPAEDGKWIYRISTLGKMDGTEVMQNFYLVAGPDGQQIVLAFTLTPKQADRLGTRDLSLAGSLEFPQRKE